MGQAKWKWIFEHMRTAKAQIRLRTAQSDQGLSCPLTESFVTIECISGERMPGRDFAHAWVEPEVVHFAHAGRYIFVWCGPYESHLLLPVQSVKCILSVNGIYSKYWDTLTPWAGLGGAVRCASDWRPGGRGFDPRRGRQHSFVEIDHEIFSTVILSLPLIQEGQWSVSGKRMCTILVNRLED